MQRGCSTPAVKVAQSRPWWTSSPASALSARRACIPRPGAARTPTAPDGQRYGHRPTPPDPARHDLKHQFQVRQIQIRNDLRGLFRGRQKIPRRIIMIQRFNQDRQIGRLRTGITQVVGKASRGLCPLGKTRHHMHGPAVDCAGIGDGLINRGAGLRPAPGQGAQPVFAPRHIAPRRIQAQHRQAGFEQRGAHGLCVMVIGPVTFHRVKSRTFGRANGVGQGQFGPQKPQIGGKFGHTSHSTSNLVTRACT